MTGSEREQRAVQVVLVIAYLVGWAAWFYVVIPASVQGPAGAWLYRACVLQPGSWALGLPFVTAAFVVATLWPLVLVGWLLAGRRPPPLITTQALLDRYGQHADGSAPVLTHVPAGVPKRVRGAGLDTRFATSREFWAHYFAEAP